MMQYILCFHEKSLESQQLNSTENYIELNIRDIFCAGVWVWPLFAVPLWRSGGEFPRVGWLADEFFGKFVGGCATGAVKNGQRNKYFKSVSTENWQWKKIKTIINPQIELPCETGSNVWPLGTVGGQLPCSVGWLTGGCSGKLNTKGAVGNALGKQTFGLIPITCC